jgi:hypothetical protein
MLSWVEIYVESGRAAKKNAPSSFMYVDVNSDQVVSELIKSPQTCDAENYFPQQIQEAFEKKLPPKVKKARKAFSYVVAIEHDSDSKLHSIVDVTRDYAKDWSQTLVNRGCRNVKKSKGVCTDTWWAQALAKISKTTPVQQQEQQVNEVNNTKGRSEKLPTSKDAFNRNHTYGKKNPILTLIFFSLS